MARVFQRALGAAILPFTSGIWNRHSLCVPRASAAPQLVSKGRKECGPRALAHVKLLSQTGSEPRLNMDRLSPDLKLVARRELGETPQVRRDAVVQLRTLITEEQSLQCPLDEEFLVKFLRGRKYRVMDTLEVIRKYFQVRLEYTDIFDNLLPSRIMFDTIYRRHRVVTVLKEPDSLGRPILVARLGVWNPSLCSMTELFRAIVLVAEYSLLDPKTQITGIVALVDLEGLHFTHLPHYTVSELKKAVKLIQECYPVRIRGIYIINNPPVFELFQPALKLFMKPKLFETIHFIGRDYDKLYQLVPRERLPEDYGGTMAKFDYDEFEKTLSSAENFFLELLKYGYRKDKASKYSSGPKRTVCLNTVK